MLHVNLDLGAIVAPALSSRPQQAINDQIGQKYDVYLGILWTKIGTATGAFESGTVEEYELARERSADVAGIRLAALFKKGAVDPDSLDPGQLAAVRAFKEKISSQGMFYREFSDENSLRSMLNLLFEQIARNKEAYIATESPNDTVIAKGNADRTGQSGSEEGDDIGLFEVGQEFADLSNQLTDLLGKIAEAENGNTSTLSSCTEEISSLMTSKKVDQQAAMKVVKEAADSLDGLAAFIEQSLPSAEDIMLEMARLIDSDLRIRLEFAKPGEVVPSTISEMKNLSLIINGAIEQLDLLIKATDELPRLSTDIARVKKRLSAARNFLRNLFVSFEESINNSISFFEEQMEPNL